MVAKKGLVMKMSQGQTLIVDAVQVVNGVEYVIFFSVEDKVFVLATEEMVDGSPKYNFLGREEAIKVAQEIDKLRG